MKKIVITFLITLISASCSFAETVKLNKMHGQMPWQLTQGSLIRFTNTKPLTITISVNHSTNKIDTQVSADRVTLDCDGFVAKIDPGHSQTCELKDVNHHADLYISQDDFHSGAEGTYHYEQLE